MVNGFGMKVEPNVLVYRQQSTTHDHLMAYSGEEFGLFDFSAVGNVAKWVKTVQNGKLHTDVGYFVHLIYSDGKIIIE